jgi:hypothetical protein
MNNNSYSPVPWEFREMIDEAMEADKNSVVHFFNLQDQVDSVQGKILKVEEMKGEGEFLVMEKGEKVRLDKIITLYGKPGPAYGKYDSFANACLDCTGGYDL